MEPVDKKKIIKVKIIFLSATTYHYTSVIVCDKQCFSAVFHLLLFRCCLLFVVLNKDLMILYLFSTVTASPRAAFCFCFYRGSAGYTSKMSWTLQTSGSHVYCTLMRMTMQKYKWQPKHSFRRRVYFRKALCISAGQCKNTYCSYYNSMAP